MSQPDWKRFQLLAALDDEQRDAIARELEAVELDAGTELFDEGEQAEGLCFIAEGGLRVESTRSGGPGLELGPGTALGALSLVASGAREVRAETTTRTRVLVLRRSAFRRFADAEPRAACRLLEAILRDTARLGRDALALQDAADIDPMRYGH